MSKSWQLMKPGGGVPAWSVVDSDGGMIAQVPREADARFIAKAPDIMQVVAWLLPMAESYLAGAPSHPDNAKLEDARVLVKEFGRRTKG
jgi:hypothetical protein